MKNIFIYASELAVITGDNVFQELSDIILKYYANHFPLQYTLILSRLEEQNYVITQKEEKEETVERVLKKNNNEFIETIKECLKSEKKENLGKEQKELLNKLENIKEDEKKNINVLETIKKCFDNEKVENLQKNQKIICDKLMKNENVKLDDKKEFKEALISMTNTNFGTKQENSALVEYENKNNKNIITTTDFFKKPLLNTENINWYLGGKVDGIDLESRTVIEIKNRVRCLFYKLRNYEKVQCYAYMYLLDMRKTHLIERLKSDNSQMNVIEFDFENDYFQDHILYKINKFTRLFEKILNDDNLLVFLLTEDKKNIKKFLKNEMF